MLIYVIVKFELVRKICFVSLGKALLFVWKEKQNCTNSAFWKLEVLPKCSWTCSRIESLHVDFVFLLSVFYCENDLFSWVFKMLFMSGSFICFNFVWDVLLLQLLLVVKVAQLQGCDKNFQSSPIVLERKNYIGF